MLRADVTLAADIPIDSLLGRVLDEKYRLDERLGEGGMGTVYRATHLLIDRPVAVKVLTPRLVTDEAARERFRREARAAGRLQHTNAVAVTDFGETSDGLVYIVMELLEGCSLRDVVAQEAPLDPARAVSLMLQVSAAVAVAHEAGIIHRDLKPGNIFIVQRSHAPHIVKVLDFGIAKIASDGVDGVPFDTLTGAGVMIGTPRYMSPEQCDGADLAPASDVYSLGVILYEMLAGVPPFNGTTPLALALKHSTETPRPPREIVSAIPPALEEVALHALEKRPEDRPSDASAFRRELYITAERLGLEHAAGFSAPTIETLRGAGTETPSGRFVIDIERLRQSRAAPITAEVDGVSTTATDEVIRTDGKPATPAPTANRRDSEGSRRARKSTSGSVGRLKRSRGAWWRQQTPALVGLAVIALALVVATLFWFGSNREGNGAAGDREEAIGRNLSATEQMPRAHQPTGEPRAAGEFYERGTYYFSSRNFDGAISDYRRALELQPNFPYAHNRLGRTLMMKGRFGDAAAEFREAIKQRGGSFAAAQYNLGYALQLQNDNVAALEAYSAAIDSRDGKYPDAFFQIGIIHLKLRRDPEAAAALRQAIEQNDGRDADSQHALGVALARQKDYAGAETALRAAIDERGGDFADAHYNLGLLYQQTQRPVEAVREFETYLRQQPDGQNRRLVENSLRDLRRAVEQNSPQP